MHRVWKIHVTLDKRLMGRILTSSGTSHGTLPKKGHILRKTYYKRPMGCIKLILYDVTHTMSYTTYVCVVYDV